MRRYALLFMNFDVILRLSNMEKKNQAYISRKKKEEEFRPQATIITLDPIQQTIVLDEEFRLRLIFIFFSAGHNCTTRSLGLEKSMNRQLNTVSVRLSIKAEMQPPVARWYHNALVRTSRTNSCMSNRDPYPFIDDTRRPNRTLLIPRTAYNPVKSVLRTVSTNASMVTEEILHTVRSTLFDNVICFPRCDSFTRR